MTTIYVTSQNGHCVWVFVYVLSCAHLISRVRDMSHIVLCPAWLSKNSIMMSISHFPFLSPSLPLPLSPCELFSHITTHNVSTKWLLTATVAITPSSAWLHIMRASVLHTKVILKQVWSLLEKLSAIVWLKIWEERWESNKVNRVKTLSELRILTLGSWFMWDWVLSEIWCFTLHRSFHKTILSCQTLSSSEMSGEDIVLSTLIWSTHSGNEIESLISTYKEKKWLIQ